MLLIFFNCIIYINKWLNQSTVSDQDCCWKNRFVSPPGVVETAVTFGKGSTDSSYNGNLLLITASSAAATAKYAAVAESAPAAKSARAAQCARCLIYHRSWYARYLSFFRSWHACFLSFLRRCYDLPFFIIPSAC